VKGVFIIAYDQNHGHCSSLKMNGAGGMAGKKKKCSKTVSVEKNASR